jgi:hypothetical protein
LKARVFRSFGESIGIGSSRVWSKGKSIGEKEGTVDSEEGYGKAVAKNEVSHSSQFRAKPTEEVIGAAD